MKCPHCGAPMTDEQVFCENCGKERQLVPVYEAEIDETLKDAISGIAVDLANTQEIKPIRLVSEPEPDSGKDSHEEAEEQLNIDYPEKKASKRFVLFMIGCALAVVLLVTVIVITYRMQEQSSYDYHIKKAEEMSRASDYEQMLEHAETAREIAPNSSDAKMLMARAYDGMGNVQYAREMLEDLLAVDSAYAPAYELLIPLYEKEKEYQKIADLLNLCKDQSVLDKYVDYIATPPQMSEEQGNYEEALALKLIAPGTGKIYYTLDGSQPMERGKEYITPIVLHSGKYSVKAVYVNTYNICSSVIEAQYYIQKQKIQAPKISLASGTYTQPQYITVEVPDDSYQVYYTTDGSDPGLESTLYDEAIPLPRGDSRFAFVMYDESGIPGEIAYAQYRFEIELAFTGEQAANMLIQNLITQGILADSDGHIVGVDGKRQYKPGTVIMSNELYYYLLHEVYISPDGVSQETGDVYAVSVTTGESFRAQRNALGMFDLRKIQ